MKLKWWQILLKSIFGWSFNEDDDQEEKPVQEDKPVEPVTVLPQSVDRGRQYTYKTLSGKDVTKWDDGAADWMLKNIELANEGLCWLAADKGGMPEVKGQKIAHIKCHIDQYYRMGGNSVTFREGWYADKTKAKVAAVVDYIVTLQNGATWEFTLHDVADCIQPGWVTFKYQGKSWSSNTQGDIVNCAAALNGPEHGFKYPNNETGKRIYLRP